MPTATCEKHLKWKQAKLTLTDIKKGVSRVYWTKQQRFLLLSSTWPVNTMENQYPPAIYGIAAYGGISARKGENVAAVLRCKARFPDGKKMVCASKPWRLCVVRAGHRRAHISRKPRTKSSKNLNVALSHQPTFISRQLKDRFQHVNVQHDQYFVFQFKLYAQRNLGTLFLTWSRWLSTLEKNPAKPKRENVRPSVG